MRKRQLFIGLLASALVVSANLVSGATTTAAHAASDTALPTLPVQRLAGDDRMATAIAVSQSMFPSAGGAHVVVLARADAFPDALVGGPLAGELGGAVLLTNSKVLNSAVAAELARVLSPGGTVYVLGGQKAIDDTVVTAVGQLGFTATRVAGTDRFATAVAVADLLGDPSTVFEASGLSFPDALAGTPAAIVNHAAILLTNGSTQAAETATYLATHSSLTRVALGGPAAMADPAATAIVGADRYDTANRVASQFFPTPTTLGVAVGTNYPDALAAGPAVAAQGAPLLLLPPNGPVPGAVAASLLDSAPRLTGVIAFGGAASLSDAEVTSFDELASLGVVTKAADAAPEQQQRYGVRSEKKETNVAGVFSGLTMVGDAETGDATVYEEGGGTQVVAGGFVSRGQQALMPTSGQELKDYILNLYGVPFFDDDEQGLVRDGQQIVLNPVMAPSLRLATYALIAQLPDATVETGTHDALGRPAIAIRIKPLIYDGFVFYLDPQTATPLEDELVAPVDQGGGYSLYLSFTRTDTMPADPYT